jgi:hypothetical protein
MRCNTGPCRKPDAINIQSGLLVVSGDIRSFDPRGQFFPLQLLWRNTSLGQRVCMHDTSERRKNERAENFRIAGSHNPFPFFICPRHKAPRRPEKIETNGVANGVQIYRMSAPGQHQTCWTAVAQRVSRISFALVILAYCRNVRSTFHGRTTWCVSLASLLLPVAIFSLPLL